MLENPALIEDLDPRFPDPRTYHSIETNSTVKFKYLYQMDEQKLLFVGKTDNGESIRIKFVRRYSKAAHEKCATMGIAPKLRGFEDIGAKWTMVIMDDLSKEYKTFDKNSLPAATHEHIRAGLDKLHQTHFVHGDVRDVNIMVRKDGKPGFMLVDFDLAGVIDEVHNPYNPEKVNIWRPDDVSDGVLIKAEHDIATLENIFR
jgi:aminoglycoside phosphotransferase (APT) family kinase protein